MGVTKGLSRWRRSHEEERYPDSRELEYRRYAATLVESANRAAKSSDKLPLLVMADAWLRLAEKIGRAGL